MCDDVIPVTKVELLPHGILLTASDGAAVRLVPLHWRDVSVELSDNALWIGGPSHLTYMYPPMPERPNKHAATDDEWRRYDEELVTNSERALAMYRGVLASWYVWARESLGYVVPGGRHD